MVRSRIASGLASLVIGVVPSLARASDDGIDENHRTVAIDSRGKAVPPPFLRGDVGIGFARAPLLELTTVVHARLGGGGDHWHVAVGASHWGRHGVASIGPWTGRHELWAFDVRACSVAPRRRWSVPLCAGLDAGSVRGPLARHPREVRAPWVAATVGGGVHWWAHRLVGFGLSVEAMAIVVRPELDEPSMRADPRRFLGMRASLEVAFRAIP